MLIIIKYMSMCKHFRIEKNLLRLSLLNYSYLLELIILKPDLIWKSNL